MTGMTALKLTLIMTSSCHQRQPLDMEHQKHLLPGETQKDLFLKLGHRQRLSQSSRSEDQHESDVQSFATELSHPFSTASCFFLCFAVL